MKPFVTHPILNHLFWSPSPKRNFVDEIIDYFWYGWPSLIVSVCIRLEKTIAQNRINESIRRNAFVYVCADFFFCLSGYLVALHHRKMMPRIYPRNELKFFPLYSPFVDSNSAISVAKSETMSRYRANLAKNLAFCGSLIASYFSRALETTLASRRSR